MHHDLLSVLGSQDIVAAPGGLFGRRSVVRELRKWVIIKATKKECRSSLVARK